MRRKFLNAEKSPPSYRKLRFLSDSSRVHLSAKTAKPMVIVLMDITAEQVQTLELNNEPARAFHDLRFIMERQLGLPMILPPPSELLQANRKPQRCPTPTTRRWLRSHHSNEL